MGLAAIYFSANKMELHEWLDGRMDIKWSKLVDEENGVLSKRFAKAFFNDMGDEVENFREKAISGSSAESVGSLWIRQVTKSMI